MLHSCWINEELQRLTVVNACPESTQVIHVSQLEVIGCGRGFHLTVQGQNMLPFLILPHIAISIVLFAMQVTSGIPSNRGRGALLAVPACETDPLRHSLWFLPGSLWDYLLFIYPLLCGGRDTGDSDSQTTLFQEFLELSGCCDCCGRLERNVDIPAIPHFLCLLTSPMSLFHFLSVF